MDAACWSKPVLQIYWIWWVAFLLYRSATFGISQTWFFQTLFLAGVPLQNLVMKFFPEFSPVLLCRAVGIWGWSSCWSSFCLNVPAKQAWKLRPKLRQKTSPRTAPLQNADFAQNFALQKPFATPGCLQFLRRGALLHSFPLFWALSFILRMTAFGNLRQVICGRLGNRYFVNGHFEFQCAREMHNF